MALSKIEIHLPWDFGASVHYDEARRMLTLEPKLNQGTMPILGIEMLSTDGTVDRALLQVNLGTGRLELPRGARTTSATDAEASEDDRQESADGGKK